MDQRDEKWDTTNFILSEWYEEIGEWKEKQVTLIDLFRGLDHRKITVVDAVHWAFLIGKGLA